MGEVSTPPHLLGVQNVMKPNPLERLVAGSFITITSATSPNWEKYSRTFCKQMLLAYKKNDAGKGVT
jgi:hypothetical protein